MTASDIFKEEVQTSNLDDITKGRFSADSRLKEVHNLLNYTKEMTIKLEHIPRRDTLSEE